MKLIIDTNVPKTAANTSPVDRLDAQAARRCLKFIKELMEKDPCDVVVLDAGQEILTEYKNNLSSMGQDNVASEFLKWIYRGLTLRNENYVELYPITQLAEGIYQEYPDSPGLEKFDKSDRKFVALSNAHPEHPPIIEGTDSWWWHYKDEFEAIGIHIVFLCEEYVQTKYEAMIHE